MYRGRKMLPFLLFASGCFSATAADPKTLDELVAQQAGALVDKGGVVGAAVGVITDGKAHTFYLGHTRKDGVAAPMPDTLFEIGSITKVFTGTLLAAMQLDDTVALDDPVRKLLPEDTAMPDHEGHAITLANLAEQNSGLPRLPDNLGEEADPYARYTTEKLYAFLAGHKLRRAPGAEYEYSNLGVGLLGHALALRSGQTYDDLLRARILAPLGMDTTFVKPSEADRARVAQGYGLTIEALGFHVLSDEIPWTWDVLAPCGGLRSTLPDMMKFLAAAMGGETPLEPAFALAEAPRFEVSPEVHLGLNWHLSTNLDSRQTLTWHNGGTGGFHSFLGFKQGNGIVILANTSNDEVDTAAINILDGIGHLPAK